METKELSHILVAFIVFTIISSALALFEQDWNQFGWIALFCAIILIVNIGAKKIMAYSLDAGIEHELWTMERFGLKAHYHVKKYMPEGVPTGIILPLLISFFSLGMAKLPAFLTYETKALTHRAAKRFGIRSWSEMTDWHNGIIGAAGIIAVLALSFISYFPGYEYLAKLAAYYAFANMIPISKLDGTQIFFGSRVLYSVLAALTLIFFAYAISSSASF